MTGVVSPASLVSLSKHVQEISIDGDEPPPRYLVKDCNGIADPSPPVVEIPVIDVGLLSEEGSDELEKLKFALISYGCFQAIGHSIPISFLDKIRELTKQFFALPMEEKLKYARAPDNLEGYGNDPILSDKQVLDWSDRLICFLAPEDSRKLQFWPVNPSEFRDVLNEYSAKTKAIIHLLLKAMARSLNLEEDCFLDQYGGREVMMARFNFYPVCPRPALVLGAKAHSDGSGITVLLPDKYVEGLQIFKDDQWCRVPIIPNALVVNAGDQLQIMSNGIFKSPMHRVSVSSEKERISLAVFHAPDPEAEIGPAEGLTTEERPQQYRKLKNFAAINFECFQNGKVALDTVKI